MTKKFEVGQVWVDGYGVKHKIIEITEGEDYPIWTDTSRSYTLDGHYYNADTGFHDLEKQFIKSTEIKSQRHKHADLIHAWAEGAQIQYWDTTIWLDANAPSWAEHLAYRIKPSKVIKKYRMAETIAGVMTYDVTDSSLDDPPEHNINGFIRWLTDPVEVEQDAS